LCFDHPKENYFDEDKDVSVGYVFADILSLYVFVRLIYTEMSKTYGKVEEFMEKEHLEVKLVSAHPETLIP
jgi:hypothetical protein